MDMYKYICTNCNYKTNNYQAWYQHTKTKKHLRNIDNTKIVSNINDDKHMCSYCGKSFTRQYSLKRHQQNRCQEIKNLNDSENQEYTKIIDNDNSKIMMQKVLDEHSKLKKELKEEKEEHKKQMDELIELVRINSEQPENIINNYQVTNQNNLLNMLNFNYNNIISMDQFLHNMEYINKIPESDLEAIAYASEHMAEGDLADTIHKTLEKNCREQTIGKKCPTDGKELIPIMPVVCTDGNCRSHKEKVKDFWETVYNDKHFDCMLNIIDKRIFEVLKKKIYIEKKRKKTKYR